MRNVLLFLLLPLFSFGQTDTFRVDPNHVEKRSSIGLSGISNNPGVGYRQIILQGDFSNYIKYKNKDYLLRGNYITSFTGSKRIQDDGSLFIQPRMFYNHWNIFAFEQVSKAYSRRLDIRYETALGGGRYIYKSLIYTLTGSYAVLYDYTNYNRDSLITTKIVRHSARIQMFGTIDRVYYFFEIYYPPKLNEVSYYNYRNKVELRYSISKFLSFTTIYTSSYESYIVYGNHLVSNLTFGLRVNY
jgi:hypothetical protein